MRGHPRLKLMCIQAHPDDESFATGGILATYAATGIETFLLIVTRGEQGWFGAPDDNPDPAAVGHTDSQVHRRSAQTRSGEY